MNEEKKKLTLADRLAVVISTCGVGYLPIAPGTWGSLVGVAIYLVVFLLEYNFGIFLLHRGWLGPQLESWMYTVNLVLLLFLTLVGIAAATRASKIFNEKDPSRTVIDEVMGQLIVFLFIPLTTTWWLIAAGFLLFRLFDIWKPYPVHVLQDLPGGLGVCADDIVAGIYAGIALSVIYSLSFSF
ncbi:MAG: phosphatidylglycerophosphatase A [Acidobacteria bacterium]|nr:MAG: phosphatidylglycerophosphatase A [Acidobacteriota bacterium]REK02121.1 MAG: phosphatidylglycerophosphatase A [Acidobacteriota bacterium]REK14077.1 MAG: phosphatidylglycerophosphatase A [Acidobacteriota bacterium]REK42072.1 MAG: phosphatidylglycerophosphatase A [Acidobacteriota bacterium]